MQIFPSNSFFLDLFAAMKTTENKKLNLSESFAGDKIPLETIATAMVVSFVSSCFALFDFSVILKGKKAGKEESYLLNVSPNPNQSGPDFWQDVGACLLLNGKAVVFEYQGHLYIADDFTVTEQPFGADIYSIDYSRGAVSHTIEKAASEVLHFKLPGGFSAPPRASSLFADYRDIAALAKEGYIPDLRYTLEVSSLAQGDPNFEKNYEKTVNDSIVPFLKSKKAVLPLFDGFNLNPVDKNSGARSTSEATDHANVVTEAIKKAANLYHVPPGLILGADASTNEGMIEDFMSFCLQPLAKVIGTELTRKRLTHKDVTAGSKIVCDPSKVVYFDILRRADKVEKLIGSGYYTIDELKTKTGELPTGEPVCNERLITKNFNVAQEGGEKDGES